MSVDTAQQGQQTIECCNIRRFKDCIAEWELSRIDLGGKTVRVQGLRRLRERLME